MNRKQYYDKHQNLNISQDELQRKFLLHRRELEHQMMMEAAMRAQGSQESAASAAGSGGLGNAILIDFFYNFFEGTIPDYMYQVDFWNFIFNVGGINQEPFTVVSVSDNGDSETFRVNLAGPNSIIVPALAFSLYKKSSILIKRFLDPSGVVKRVNYAAFSNQDGLVQVDLSGCVEMEDFVFSYCDVLSDVNLPNLLTSIGGIFYECLGLTTISLPSYLGSAYGYDFTGCSNLQAADLSSCQIALPNFFSGCTSLQTVRMDSVSSIGDYCFYNCSSLTSLYIPSCVQIGQDSGNNDVFSNISGNSIALTIPCSLMTADSGSPDGDIVILASANDLTINGSSYPIVTIPSTTVGLTGASGGTGAYPWTYTAEIATISNPSASSTYMTAGPIPDLFSPGTGDAVLALTDPNLSGPQTITISASTEIVVPSFTVDLAWTWDCGGTASVIYSDTFEFTLNI